MNVGVAAYATIPVARSTERRRFLKEKSLGMKEEKMRTHHMSISRKSIVKYGEWGGGWG